MSFSIFHVNCCRLFSVTPLLIPRWTTRNFMTLLSVSFNHELYGCSVDVLVTLWKFATSDLFCTKKSAREKTKKLYFVGFLSDVSQNLKIVTKLDRTFRQCAKKKKKTMTSLQKLTIYLTRGSFFSRCKRIRNKFHFHLACNSEFFCCWKSKVWWFLWWISKENENVWMNQCINIRKFEKMLKKLSKKQNLRTLQNWSFDIGCFFICIVLEIVEMVHSIFGVTLN